MLRILYKIYWSFLILINLPLILSEFLRKRTGEEYGVGLYAKLLLVYKMIRNNIMIASASNFIEHLTMATSVLSVPKSVDGSVVECGSYKGGSTANLSLVCDLCDRELMVFDSFEGLPEPSKIDQAHVLIDTREIHTYSKGALCGTLDEVRENISRYGKIERCNFHVGYFEETLPRFDEKAVFIFLDVDLRSSLESCVTSLWALLQNGCYLYTHEAPHIEIASLFFDYEWWRDKFASDAPGLIGAGNGLGLIPHPGSYKSAIGYTVKNPGVSEFKEVPQTGLR
jgi:hypothetical protein